MHLNSELVKKVTGKFMKTCKCQKSRENAFFLLGSSAGDDILNPCQILIIQDSSMGEYGSQMNLDPLQHGGKRWQGTGVVGWRGRGVQISPFQSTEKKEQRTKKR